MNARLSLTVIGALASIAFAAGVNAASARSAYPTGWDRPQVTSATIYQFSPGSEHLMRAASAGVTPIVAPIPSKASYQFVPGGNRYHVVTK